ncbi:DUF4350 domain-containing protein [Natrinema pallidum]|uniref:DUF4350 domain-containing protein n=1 Tax=Natrinema pallidum TaxID=69527 RepID=A0A4P9TM08_9EURY|nr:DUF4350 domain-containing protein [Natrinema pallidum]QCW05080.1 DUF4350 domain-containing protein [Natrinema pallidum]
MSWHRDVLGGGGAIDWPRVLLLAVGVSVLITLGTVGVTSSSSFGLYNPSWDGTSEFRKAANDDPTVESHLLRETTEYAELPANETVAFVISPDKQYKNEDIKRIREFVTNGGTLVVLENFGEPGNALLADLGTEARVDGRLLRDERHHFRGPTMPVATDIENHTLTSSVDRVTLNYGTVVNPGEATVLVATSDFGYLGPEEDDLDEQDELRSYPVATVENVSSGQVVVVGDPSLTINTMYDEPDNAAFVGGLYADADYVVFDRSHGASVPPLASMLHLIRNSALLQLLVGSTGIGLVAVVSQAHVRDAVVAIRSRLPARLQPAESRVAGLAGTGLSDAEQAEYLRRRHPDWDEDRIQRITTALNTPRSEGTNDE